MTSKRLIAVLCFLIPLIVDWLFPGSGIVMELAILIWELLELEATEE
ncbi:MAG: hypothetical protein ACRAVC_03420 [Trichormus sp.]